MKRSTQITLGPILAGDIGGTNTRLAVFDDRARRIGPIRKFPTGDGTSLEARIAQVRDQHRGAPVRRACLAIAGPVIEGVCDSTNIGRTFVDRKIRKETGLDSLLLINDLVANAAGIESLERQEIVTLIKGESHKGNCAIVSPGTGLGEGALVWDNRHHRPIASEGGHARFAPTSDQEQDLLDFLSGQFDTVTFEDVCSGRGIENLFDFFVDQGADVPKVFARKLHKLPPGRRGALISDAAMSNQCDAALRAMNQFVRILGVECANLALKVFATGGVYLGGGIPPKILPLLKTPIFKQAFLHHRVEAISNLLTRFPVRVILNDDTALEGAALFGNHFG